MAELGVSSIEVVIEAACSFRACGSVVCCGKQFLTSHLVRRLARCLWAPTDSLSQCVGSVCLILEKASSLSIWTTCLSAPPESSTGPGSEGALVADW